MRTLDLPAPSCRPLAEDQEVVHRVTVLTENVTWVVSHSFPVTGESPVHAATDQLAQLEVISDGLAHPGGDQCFPRVQQTVGRARVNALACGRHGITCEGA
jgi:hypothetical protein